MHYNTFGGKCKHYHKNQLETFFKIRTIQEKLWFFLQKKQCNFTLPCFIYLEIIALAILTPFAPAWAKPLVIPAPSPPRYKFLI